MSAVYGLISDIKKVDDLSKNATEAVDQQQQTNKKAKKKDSKMKKQIKTQAAVTAIKTSTVLLAAALIALITPSAATARPQSQTPTASLLVSGLGGTQGSTVGADGALYLSESLE